MYNSLIAASLFQNNSCTLPGIGSLHVLVKNAQSDFVNTQILSPVYSIHFTPNNPATDSFNEFSAISEILKNELEQTGKIDLDGIGTLTRDTAGSIIFIPGQLDDSYTPPVKAERVLRENAAHNMLVGDRETTNVVMAEYFSEETVKKDLWWIWAIVMGAIAAALVIAHVTQHGYNIGNSHILFP